MSARLVLLQQQQLAPRGPLIAYSDPWQWWTPDDVARITNTPIVAVTSDWPIIYAALEAWGCADYDTCRVALATIAIETAHTFKPVVEAFWLDDDWRWANLRYAPYWGRGYVQLTWQSNYEWYGFRIGHPELVTFPEKALEPFIASQLLAAFFVDNGIPLVAAQHNWAECRRRVQGADAGLQELIQMVGALDAARLENPLTLREVLAYGRERVGDPYVWDGEAPGGFDCSGFVSWCYEMRLTTYTDDIFRETNEQLYPAPGDIVLYEYYDPNQANTRFPHVGLWLDNSTTLDARYGYGVGVHPHLVGAKQYVRRVPGVIVDTLRLAA